MLCVHPDLICLLICNFTGGTEIGKGGPLLAAKISPGGPKFSLHPQRKLLCTPNLTLAMTLEKARAAETATRETQQLNPSPATAHNLAQHRRGRASECHRCGKAGHTGDNCIHKDKRCHYCKKVGHLSSVCFKKKSEARVSKKHPKNKRRETNMVDVDTSESDKEAFDTSHNLVPAVMDVQRN